MSYFNQIQVTDIFDNLIEGTAYNELRVCEEIRIAGATFAGPTIDPNFLATTLTGSATATQADAQLSLATGVTANSTALLQTVSIARHITVSQNRFLARVQLGDTGTVNNTRRWGPFNGTDGAYFKVAGTTVSACTMRAGVETAVASTAWNGNQTVPLLTNSNLYEILYTPFTVVFVINKVIAHTATFNAGTWTGNIQVPAYMDNVNSGGLALNRTLTARTLAISRMGKENTQPKFFHGTTAATTVLKFAAGTLHRLILNTPTGTLITIYDNTAGSGPVIAAINAPSQADPVTLVYSLPFQTGLTLVTTGTWDFTVVYE